MNTSTTSLFDVRLKKYYNLTGKAINIEYGKIEKLWGLLNRNHSNGNIEFNFENGNIDSKMGGKTG